MIDFYFACNDALAYDVAICLNAWCFEADHSYNVTKGRALLQAYARVRPLGEAERAALPRLARGAALRFLLTRLVDWFNVPPGALVRPKDPMEYFRKLRFHQKVKSVQRLRDRRMSEPHVDHPHRRRLLGQSGAGRLGRDPRLRRSREGDEGRRAAHHQQPHGADGRDRGAGSAEAAVPGRSPHRQPVHARRHHEMDPRLEAQRLAHRRQEAGQEHRPVAAARRRARAASRQLALGEGPCRPCRERARRRARARRDRGDPRGRHRRADVARARRRRSASAQATGVAQAPPDTAIVVYRPRMPRFPSAVPMS